MEWLLSRRLRQRTFRISPLDQLEEIGFSRALENNQTKWQFTQEIKAAYVNDFFIACVITRDNPKEVRFWAAVESKRIDKDEFERLDKLLAKEDIEFDYNGLFKKYQVKTLKTLSIEELHKELKQFTYKLRELGFSPDDETAKWQASH